MKYFVVQSRGWVRIFINDLTLGEAELLMAIGVRGGFHMSMGAI